MFPLILFGIINWLARLVLLGVGLLGLAHWRRLPAELRYVVGLAWFGLTIESLSVLKPFSATNLWLIPIDAAGELWLMSLVYAEALQSTVFSRWRPWVAGAFVLYAGFSLATDFETARFKPAVQVLESLLVMVMAGLYFRKLLDEMRVLNLARDPLFWVSAGLLLYSVSKLLIVLFSNYMLDHYSRHFNISVWAVHSLLAIMLYLCYFRALWLRLRK